MRKPILIITLILIMGFGWGISFAQTRERAEIPDRYTWDLTPIYASDADWQKHVDELDKKVDELELYQGTLGKSAKNLADCLELSDFLEKDILRAYCYAFFKFDLDTRSSEAAAMRQKSNAMLNNLGTKTAFINPEILAINPKKLQKFISQEPRLEKYKFILTDLLRTKEHLRSGEVEEIIAQVADVAGGPASIYGLLTNADFPFPEIVISTGDTLLLNQQNFGFNRAQKNPADRKAIFDAFFGKYFDFERTFGSIYDTKIKKDIFYADARGYNNTLEYYLDNDNIPPEVYLNLIKNVKANLNTFHRYLNIRKRMLGVEQLEYTDMYVPLVKDLDVKYSAEETEALLCKSLKPLGKQYVDVINRAFNERWIDYYSTPGKRPGAYNMGVLYDVHPYILMNFDGTYNNVSTLTHEIGHSMHSWFAIQNQAYCNFSYSTFVAEVASTLNEILLFRYLMDTLEDEDMKLFLLIEYVDRIKSTVFRQTKFAEFELKAHQLAEEGQPITGESMTQLYKELVREYYGHDQGICNVDDIINIEWAYIPHFYRNYYVFQYSTSWTASEALASDIYNGDKEAVKKYIDFISTGGADYPIDVLKKAGVDMTTDAPFNTMIKSMNWAMDEIDKILTKKGI